MKRYKPTAMTIEVYTCGDCWMLARAIHDITGWDGILYAPDAEDEPWYWTHVAVMTPNGKILDIEGEHDPADFLARWDEGEDLPNSDYIAIETADQWEEAICDQVPAYYPDAQAWPRARKVARRILADYGF